MTKQEQSLSEWLNGYKKRIDQYNEPQRIAHRKEINNYLKEVGNKFNLR
tara:strand:- start:285 stop:431 length:147 start_codon:yes stop_codon:yes gene_type:complete